MITQTDIERLNKEYAEFERCCRFWIDKLGLKDWNIAIKQCLPGEKGGEGTFAVVSTNLIARTATLRFYGDLFEPAPAATGLHEVLHILLEPLVKDENARNNDEEHHAVIHRLIPLLMLLYYKEKEGKE